MPTPNSVRPMSPRDVDEIHRAATPLELLFDLVSVIAIAAAVAGLHHAIAEDHIVDGVFKYAAIFFAIWWAWMNYTWFASAYDNDDGIFRLLTMVVMAGALMMAAGVGAFFESLDLTLTLGGYVVMRVAMVAFWLRASFHDPDRRATALSYAGGITLAQALWVVIALVQPESLAVFYGLFAVGIVVELLVPAFAERQTHTTWHRHHMMERYGLLIIIVLGETLLAGSMALEQAAEGPLNWALVRIAVLSLVILFSMWWLYFSKEEHLESKEFARALAWGYGHVFIFMSGAAVGAGFAVLVDIATDHAAVGWLTGVYAVAVPVSVYLMGLWFSRDRFALTGTTHFVLPVFAILILAAPPFIALEGVAALTVLSVIVRNRVSNS